jgi:hypothetical protein
MPVVLCPLPNLYRHNTGVSSGRAILLPRDSHFLPDCLVGYGAACCNKSEKSVDALKKIYISIDIPLDEYLFRRKLVTELESRFNAATGASESGDVLVAVMMTYRKRDIWPTIREVTPEKLRPFGDIHEVVRRYGIGS